jgi:hypothetical protein
VGGEGDDALMEFFNGKPKIKINQTLALAKKGRPDFSRIATVTFLVFGIIMNCNTIWLSQTK